MDQQKQPDWLKVAVVTTIIGGVVQVIVNHFDNLLTLLGGAIAYIHVPGNFSIILNILSTLTTIGGAFATILAYRYRKDAKKLREGVEKIRRIVTAGLESQEGVGAFYVPACMRVRRSNQQGPTNQAQI